MPTVGGCPQALASDVEVFSCFSCRLFFSNIFCIWPKKTADKWDVLLDTLYIYTHKNHHSHIAPHLHSFGKQIQSPPKICNKKKLPAKVHLPTKIWVRFFALKLHHPEASIDPRSWFNIRKRCCPMYQLYRARLFRALPALPGLSRSEVDKKRGILGS